MMKKIIAKVLILSFFLTSTSFAAVTLEDINTPKAAAYRLGTSNDLEKEYKVIDINEINDTKKASYNEEYLKNISYSDSTLKDLSREVSKLVELDKDDMLEDVQILWTGAATKSETIKFAIYKLSNPDADKPDEGIVKKIIKPLATMSSIAGAGFMNPIAATSALMGSSFLNSMSFSDKDLNYKYTKVTDADMIILIRKVDELQKKMIREYFDYMSSYEILKMSNESLQNRIKNYNQAKNMSDDALLIADAYYRVALDNKNQLELDFLSKRAALEQLVGAEALQEFETKLQEREKDNK